VLIKAAKERPCAQTPLGRIGQPNDSAKVAVFLASSDSDWLTGEVAGASGGMR
jgi:3-oxoacyl-[acyl-carrier protein] reductase